ncbi:uncharacterized protein EI90DRAFT_3121540 [Cantharellus anzutake]|uniref:uncharacterized protein n=1 Tax=Cantharellus anzutake TaxID=1750568 RepID=UPI0019063FC7|nr:uncharacterized protein EI90DRAFT_3121540 [Cantharellus anzutake]KAF8334208.1 hypothetical protein EI90DRAFT_3121540 [Cantharellus anzutake]
MSTEIATTANKIFERNGESVKFFIQQDTGKDFIGWLSARIAEHGGKVVETVPREGYILVDPDSKKGEKLTEKWSSPDKPNRHIVCFTFVRASIMAGRMLDPEEMQGSRVIFKHEGAPVHIFLHPALGGLVSARLAIQIEKAGGSPKQRRFLRRKYLFRTDKYVEGIEWVQDCLDAQTYRHIDALPINMRGMKPGTVCVDFTETDDQNLIQYIGTRVPEPVDELRGCLSLYTQLCRSDEFPWAAQHVAKVWQRYYLRRKHDFDKDISKWVERNPQPLDSKERFRLKKRRRQPRPVVVDADMDDVVIDDDDHDSDDEDPPAIRHCR